MQLRRALPCAALFALGALLPLAHADSFSTSGTFAGDNSEFTYSFTILSATNYSFRTTSFAQGGFVPVLTVYDTGTQRADGNDGPTPSPRDASLNLELGAGSYELFLTEFPNEAAGNLLTDGFQFADDPFVTGQLAGLGDVSFIDTVDGSQRTGQYALNISSVAATPEPASWMLLLPGLGAVAWNHRRRSRA